MATPIVIITVALLTFLTRFLPFALLSNMKKLPDQLQYIGDVLPAAIISLLVLYCLKDTPLFQYQFNLLNAYKELLAIAVVILSHLLFKRSVLSIFCGTFLYVLLSGI